MPEYLFAAARPYQSAFAMVRADLADDEAAIRHVAVIAAAYPQAESVMVRCGDRVLARIPVELILSPDSVGRTIRESHALIARSRQLLNDTGPSPARRP